MKVRYNGYYVNLCEKESDQCDYNEFVGRIRAEETNYEEQCGLKTMTIS